MRVTVMKVFLVVFAMLLTLPALAVEPVAAPAPPTAPVAGEDPPPAPAPAEAPGHVDFDALAEQYGEARVLINVNGSLLRLARAIEHRNPVADAVLQGMESVQIRVYDTDGDTAPAAERIRALSARLAANQWEPVVLARDDGEDVAIFVRQEVRGLKR